MRDILPFAKKLARATGAEHYNVLQVRSVSPSGASERAKREYLERSEDTSAAGRDSPSAP